MIELNLIGFSTSGRGDTFTTGMNPATGEALSGQFPGATIDEVNQAVTSAQDAAVVYGKMPGKEKAEFLNAIAEEIENLRNDRIALDSTIIDQDTSLIIGGMNARIKALEEKLITLEGRKEYE